MYRKPCFYTIMIYIKTPIYYEAHKLTVCAYYSTNGQVNIQIFGKSTHIKKSIQIKALRVCED